MEKTKVFVLYAHRDHVDYESSTDIIATYSTKLKARKQMLKSFDDELQDEHHFGNFDKKDLRIQKSSDNCSILDVVGGFEFTSFEIVETELD